MTKHSKTLVDVFKLIDDGAEDLRGVVRDMERALHANKTLEVKRRHDDAIGTSRRLIARLQFFIDELNRMRYE